MQVNVIKSFIKQEKKSINIHSYFLTRIEFFPLNTFWNFIQLWLFLWLKLLEISTFVKRCVQLWDAYSYIISIINKMCRKQ